MYFAKLGPHLSRTLLLSVTKRVFHQSITLYIWYVLQRNRQQHEECGLIAMNMHSRKCNAETMQLEQKWTGAAAESRNSSDAELLKSPALCHRLHSILTKQCSSQCKILCVIWHRIISFPAVKLFKLAKH